jgi:hypothetical protein
VAIVILLPLGAFLLFGSVYFAPQALFPFLFMAAVVAGVLSLLSRSKTPHAVALALLLLPLGAYGLYGVRHMAAVLALRSLRADDVIRLRLSRAGTSFVNPVIDERQAVESVVRALHRTTPYSPNHESIRRPWRLTITMRDGSSRELDIGDGNVAHPGFVWIQFGVEVYQNPELRQALMKAGVNPWSGTEPR